MAYFLPQTLSDILEMKDRGDSESATLEFKSCRLFNQKNDKVFETLSKEITAFANSIGGVLIIGVEEDEHRAISEVDPITDNKKHESWIEDGLLSRISPNLHFSITKIEAGEGFLLVINVPASRNAPHQSADKRYYARRLFRVDQLLAFEIDDIRRRAVASSGGANLSVVFRGGAVSFEIENTGIGPIFDIGITIEGIDNDALAREWTPGLGRPYTDPFKIIQPKEKRSFLGAGFEFFEKHLEDRMAVTLHYTDEDEKPQVKTYTYYLKDFYSTARLRRPQEEIIEKGVQNLEKLERTIARLQGDIHKIRESAFFPSGFNLSKTTLSILSGEKDVKWPGGALSFQALAEILEVDFETALKIQRDVLGASHHVGGKNVSLAEVDLPEVVKEKIAKRLMLP